jgi:hypothetical protein
VLKSALPGEHANPLIAMGLAELFERCGVIQAGAVSWFYAGPGRSTNTAAATTEVHSPSRSPMADCVMLRVVTILSDILQMSLRCRN